MNESINDAVLSGARRLNTNIADPWVARSLRNASRVFVETASFSGNGTVFGPHHIPGPRFTRDPALLEGSGGLPEWILASPCPLAADDPQADQRPLRERADYRGRVELVPAILELYADDVPKLIAMTETPRERELKARAVDLAQMERREWLREEAARRAQYEQLRGDPLNQANWLWMNASIAPEQFYAKLGLGRRTGNLAFVRLVHPQTGERVDGAEWLALDDDARASWCIAPPVTHTNQHDLAADRMAEVLAKTFARMMPHMAAQPAEEPASRGKR